MNKSLLKARSRTLILKALGRRPGLTRQGLADITKLSFPAVSKLAQELIDENAIRENGKSESSGGRRCDLLEINPDAGDILALSIGEDGLRLLWTDFCHKPKASMSYPRVLNELGGDELGGFARECVAAFLAANKIDFGSVKCAGVAVPGYLKADGSALFSSFGYVKRLDINGLFPGPVPVFAENNCNLNALREQVAGAARDKTNVVCLSIGAGVGAGLILDGRIYTGENGVSGEFGSARRLWPDLNGQPHTLEILAKLLARYVYIVSLFIAPECVCVCHAGDEAVKAVILGELQERFAGEKLLAPVVFSDAGAEGTAAGAGIYARQRFLNEVEFSGDCELWRALSRWKGKA